MAARERAGGLYRFLQPDALLGGWVCVMRLFATALAGEQRACICTAVGWFLGRREARAAIAFARITLVAIAGAGFERGRIERGGLDREARGNKARRALQGQSYRGALHDCGYVAATRRHAEAKCQTDSSWG